MLIDRLLRGCNHRSFGALTLPVSKIVDILVKLLWQFKFYK